MVENTVTSTPRKAHFIGIGGAGMSGIALVLHERGCIVTGSDLKASHYVRTLEAEGISVRLGHTSETIDEFMPDVVVISSAIPEDNPELMRARELGIEVWQRAKMLAALGSGRSTIAIAGTHGKTTTSSMCAVMLDALGLDPSFLIGGVVEGYNTNGRNGDGEYFVAEADESDGSFLHLNPRIVVVTNVEEDHLDHYKTFENLERTFVKFMASVGEDGAVIVCANSERLVELAHESGRKVYTYGFAESCDYVCTPLEKSSDVQVGKAADISTGNAVSTDANNAAETCTPSLESSFVFSGPGATETVRLSSNPGVHNMLNATAVLAVADVLGLPIDKAVAALGTFKGARRRFTYIGDISQITVVDDYGHHPTEIQATLRAAQSLGYKRICVVFQPHRYSRTAALIDQFATAFDVADVLYVMDVFGAGEMSIPGVNGKSFSKAVREQGKVAEVHYIPNRHKLLQSLCKQLEAGDLLITLGAGDVTDIGPSFIEAMREYTRHNE